jgi:hypothetical protein
MPHQHLAMWIGRNGMAEYQLSRIFDTDGGGGVLRNFLRWVWEEKCDTKCSSCPSLAFVLQRLTTSVFYPNQNPDRGVFLYKTLWRSASAFLSAGDTMAASLLNQTLSLSATTLFTATATPSPIPDSKSPQWDAVAVYGFVFGFLAVLLAVPGTYLAIIALKKHRKHEARQSELGSVI